MSKIPTFWHRDSLKIFPIPQIMKCGVLFGVSSFFKDRKHQSGQKVSALLYVPPGHHIYQMVRLSPSNRRTPAGGRCYFPVPKNSDVIRMVAHDRDGYLGWGHPDFVILSNRPPCPAFGPPRVANRRTGLVVYAVCP